MIKGHVFSVLSGDIKQAISMSIPVLATQVLFSGFFIDNVSTCPEWIKVFRYLSIFDYSFDLQMIQQWNKVDIISCDLPVKDACIRNGTDFLKEKKINPVIKIIRFNLIIILSKIFNCSFVYFRITYG
jgi:hypothetical protein